MDKGFVRAWLQFHNTRYGSHRVPSDVNQEKKKIWRQFNTLSESFAKYNSGNTSELKFPEQEPRVCLCLPKKTGKTVAKRKTSSFFHLLFLGFFTCAFLFTTLGAMFFFAESNALFLVLGFSGFPGQNQTSLSVLMWIQDEFNIRLRQMLRPQNLST